MHYFEQKSSPVQSTAGRKEHCSQHDSRSNKVVIEKDKLRLNLAAISSKAIQLPTKAHNIIQI